MFENFFLSGAIPTNAEKGVYIPLLVLASYIVASLGSYTGLTLAVQLFNAQAKRQKRLFHWVGALALGSSIWSMHFVGMLAYKMNMAVGYDPFVTAASLVIAIIAGYVVLGIVSWQSLAFWQIAVGAIGLGIGISAMHYVGMAAMRMDAEIYYISKLFFFSVLIAIAASAAALWIAFKLTRTAPRWQTLFKVGAALIMGGAICGMHYTGMAAAVIIPYANCRYDPNQSFDALVISVITINILILLAALALDSYKRMFARQTSERLFSNQVLSILVLLAFGTAIGFMVQVKSERDYSAAVENYRKNASSEAKVIAETMNDVMGDIYRDIRTISFLPSVQKIDRNGINLDSDARESIQQLYNNLKSTADVSEIYIVPADLDPDADPAANKPLAPILMFDNLITQPKAAPEKQAGESEEKLQEEEIYEYRSLRETMAWLKEHYPNRQNFDGNNAPFVSSPQVITCDNTLYNETRRDEDRTGLIFSVPFYGPDGRLKGTISAIILSNVFEKLLQNANYALVNPEYRVVLSKAGGQDDISKQFVVQARPDPSLLYSEVIPLDVQDSRGSWFLWTGFPDSVFLKDSDMAAIRNFEYAGYGFDGLIVLFGMIVWGLLQRNFRLIKAHNTELTTRLEMDQSRREAITAREIAERSSVMKSEFLANMSHELRTPLNSILGINRLLLESGLTQKQHDLADIVFRSSVNLLEIVNDILDLSKIEAGEMKLENIGFNLHYVFHSVMHALDHIAAEKKVPIIRHYEKEALPYVMGDPTRFGRVLMNLIGNAIKYTDKGHVDVRVFHTMLDKTHINLRCEITDTGIGIPQNKLETIFEKFVQADSSTTRKYGGTGLGLAITKQLVELMGGKIGVNSEEGKGSTFWFQVPFKITDKLHEEKHIRRQKAQLGTIPPENARILIAEDHPMNQLFITELMQKFEIGYFKIVENGIDVLKAYRENTWDVILMDCHMPEKNGYDTTEDIRTLEKQSGAHIPIVAMTANAMVGDKEKCLRYGMDEYISKPIGIDELYEILSQWIQFKNNVDDKSNPSAPPMNESFDLSILRTFSKGDKEKEKRFIRVFVDQSDKNLKVLADYRANGDTKSWREAGHMFKGGALGIGANGLASLCEQAQHFEGAPQDQAALFEKIDNEYAKIKRQLKEAGLLS